VLSANGTITVAGSSPPTNPNPDSITVDPSGKYAYVANYLDGTVSEYTIGNTGALTTMATPTVGIPSTTAHPLSITTDPSGKYVYVANSGDGTVSKYTIGTTGVLTLLTTTASNSNPGAYSVTTWAMIQ